jgi:hypothetical protein
MSAFVKPLLFLPFVLGWVGYALYAKRKNYSSSATHVRGFMIGCGLQLCLVAFFVFHGPIKKTEAAYPSNLETPSYRSRVDVKVGTIFHPRKNMPSCNTKGRYIEYMIYVLGENHSDDQTIAFDSDCNSSTRFAQDEQMQVDNAEFSTSLKDDVIGFHRVNDPNKERLYTSVEFILIPPPPVPADSELKAGTIIIIAPNAAYVCDDKYSTAHLSKALDEDNQIVIKNFSRGCETNFASGVQYEVSSVEPLNGTNGDLVAFHQTAYAYDNTLYTFSHYVKRQSAEQVQTSSTSEIKPEMLFDLTDPEAIYCQSQAGLEKYIAYLKTAKPNSNKNDAGDIFKDGEHCWHGDNESVERYRVTGIEHIPGIEGQIVEFSYAERKFSDSRFYMPIKFVKPFSAITPTGVNQNRYSVKPGAHFHVYDKYFIACKSENHLFQFAKAVKDEDQKDIEVLLHGNEKSSEFFCFGNDLIFPDVTLVVDKVEQLKPPFDPTGIPVDVVAFHRASHPKTIFYTSLAYVNPSAAPIPSAAN